MVVLTLPLLYLALVMQAAALALHRWSFRLASWCWRREPEDVREMARARGVDFDCRPSCPAPAPAPRREIVVDSRATMLFTGRYARRADHPIT